MSAPSDGYHSGTKRHYRRRTWNRLEALEPLRSVPRSQRKVLVLDEYQGFESRYLVETRGYTPRNIIVAQLTGAKAARVTMSLRERGIVGVQSFGGGAAAAMRRCQRAGIQLDAIHLDFCGHALAPLVIETLRAVHDLVLPQRPIAVCVNIMRGREGWRLGKWRDLVDVYGIDSDSARAEFVLSMMCWRDERCLFPASRSFESYISTNGQSFLSLTTTLHEWDSFRQCQPLNDLRKDINQHYDDRVGWTRKSIGVAARAFGLNENWRETALTHPESPH